MLLLNCLVLALGSDINDLAAAEPGLPGPGFNLSQLDTDEVVTLKALKGQVVYLDFWASWCGPCRQSLPLYETLNQEIDDPDFSLIAINLDENVSDATDFLDQHPVSYNILLDPEGVSAQAWQIRVMPSSFLLDKNGVVVKEYAGFKASHIEELRNDILSLLQN